MHFVVFAQQKPRGGNQLAAVEGLPVVGMVKTVEPLASSNLVARVPLFVIAGIGVCDKGVGLAGLEVDVTRAFLVGDQHGRLVGIVGRIIGIVLQFLQYALTDRDHLLLASQIR